MGDPGVSQNGSLCVIGGKEQAWGGCFSRSLKSVNQIRNKSPISESGLLTPDVVGVTETWLNSTVADTEILNDNF